MLLLVTVYLIFGKVIDSLSGLFGNLGIGILESVLTLAIDIGICISIQS